MTDPAEGTSSDDERRLSWPSRRTFLAGALAGLAGCNRPPSGGEPPGDGTATNDRSTTTRTEEPTRSDTMDDGIENSLAYRAAKPGEVQDALDSAAEGRRSVVHLYPGMEYRPKSTWDVKPGVTLDYGGASVDLRRDIDLHDVRPGGQVLRPVVDLGNVAGEYTSSVFVFDSQRFGFYGNTPHWHVRGGITRGRSGEGTVFEFVQGDENAIYFVHVDHAVWETGTVVDMHRGDAFGINGVHVRGLWYGFEKGIHMRNRSTPDDSLDNISGNHFEVIAQPSDTRILWDMEVGQFNVLKGRLWDFSKYDDVMWRIHGGDHRRRIGNILHWFPVGGTEEKLFEGSLGADVFDDQLGDVRNRVVVPWLQGRPVGDLTP